MTISEPNPAIRPTGAEASEFLDDRPLSAADSAGDDPTRRPTGSLPLERTSGGDRGTSSDDGPRTDGFAIFEQDHREIARLFESFEQEGEDVVPRELCERLTHTTQREEAALCATLRGHVDGGDELADRVENENAVLATMIAELYDSATPERIPELVGALHTAVVAHVELLDSQIFPLLKERGVDARQLGAADLVGRDGVTEQSQQSPDRRNP